MAQFREYFSSKYIASKGALFNYIASDRSDGKTWDIKISALEEWLQTGLATMYVRRYKTELTKEVYENFFTELFKEKEFKDKYGHLEFRGSKRMVEVKNPKTNKWEIIVYLVPLSIAGRIKSTINPYSVASIRYDEFAPLDGRYLPGEAELLLELWKTIDRDRFQIQLFITGNRVDPFNPICAYFNIDVRIDEKSKLRLYKNDTFAVQVYSSKEHRVTRKQSKFNDLISGTPYEAYEYGGILRSFKIKSCSRDGLNYWCRFITSVGEGTLWYGRNILLVSEYKRKDGFILTDEIRNYEKNTIEYSIKHSSFANTIRTEWRCNRIYFETDKAYFMFEDILKAVNA